MKMRKLLPFVATTAIAASMFGFAANAEDFNLTVNLASEPQTMDPQMNTTLDGGTMLQHLFEGLMKWETTGEEQEGSDGTCDSSRITYGQAESYDREENEDGTVSTAIELEEGDQVKVWGYASQYLELQEGLKIVVVQPGIIERNGELVILDKNLKAD